MKPAMYPRIIREFDEEIIENLENYQNYLDTHEIDWIEGKISGKLNKKIEEKND